MLSRNLNKIGLREADDYRTGHWYGNSSKDGNDIFLDVTHNITDLVQRFYVHFKSGSRKECVGDLSCLKAKDLGHRTFGRCFEIEFGNGIDTVSYIDVEIKKTIFVYFSPPHVFYDSDSKSKFQVNVDENLFLDSTYEVLQNNFEDKCKTYSENYELSHDACKMELAYQKIITKYNCSVPFIQKRNRAVNICKNQTIANNASDIFGDHTFVVLPECPVPCVNMITIFGFPFISKRHDNLGRFRLYFKNIVKVTEDFISYDMLR